MKKRIAFDAFGSLLNFDAHSIRGFDEEMVSQILSPTRQNQLEYTWIHGLMKNHLPFDQLILVVLKDAGSIYGGDDALVDVIGNLFLTPSCFEDVLPGLEKLHKLYLKKGGLSKGTSSMLKSEIEKNALLNFYISAEEARIFKPHKSDYQLVLDQFSCAAEEADFVSSNQWEIAGAANAGLQAVWLYRGKKYQENIQ